MLALRNEGDGHEREDDQRGQPETQHASECGGRTLRPESTVVRCSTLCGDFARAATASRAASSGPRWPRIAAAVQTCRWRTLLATIGRRWRATTGASSTAA